MSYEYMAALVAVGLVIGFASSLVGVGGGVFLVPVLLYLGLNPAKTVGTSFLVITVIALVSLVSHAKLNHVDYKIAGFLVVGAVVGTQIGVRFLPHIPQAVFTKIFAVVLIATGIVLLIKKVS